MTPEGVPTTEQPVRPGGAVACTLSRWKRLLLHALALALVLAAASTFIGTHGRYSADEGAVLITASSLANGHGWLTPHPLPKADPTGRNYPLVSSDWGSKGTAAYAKHPLYPVMVAAAEQAWPGRGPVVLSILGAVIAALLAAGLARELAPGAEVLTLWLVGVASPLFVDAQLIFAHTLAAATAVAAVLAAVMAVRSERRRPSARAVVFVVAAGLAMTATVMLRTEGLILAIGMAVAFAVGGWRRHGPRTVHLLVAAAMLSGGTAAKVIDGLLFRAIVGSPVAAPTEAVFVGSGSLLAQRWHGFVVTMLQPSYGSGRSGVLLLLATALIAFACYVALGREPAPLPAAALLLGSGAVIAVVGLVLTPVNPSGLLIAFPVGWVGLVAFVRLRGLSASAVIVVLGGGLFVMGVLATQYAVGGGVEWGGRYFAVVIPLAAPFAAGGLRAAGARVAAAPRRLAAAGLVLATVGLAVLGLRTVDTTAAAADAALAGLPAGHGLGARPVVVTTFLPGPRFAGRNLDNHRWLLADPHHPAHLVARLRTAGIARFVLFTNDPAADAPVVTGAREVSSTSVGGWRYVIYAT